LSLNLLERQRERGSQEQQALVRENARRAADGLPALKALSDAPADDQPDVVLAEASRIAALLAVTGPTVPTPAAIAARSPTQ